MTDPTISREGLQELEALLGPNGFLSAEVDRARYSGDASTEAKCLPLAVLRPADTEQLIDVMRLCTRFELPVVPQGGRTGLSGGAVPVNGSAALSLERLRGVLSVDADNFCLTVWAGTPLETVQEAARAVGLDYPIDIGSRGTATIGGTLATNAGGIRVIRHGMTRQHVLGLEVVLADGTLVSNLRSMIKDNAGFDLKQMFIGSEGCLGIITKVVLRLSPAPANQHTALLGVPDYNSALTCLASARRHFDAELTAFEGMWPNYWSLATSKMTTGTAPLGGEHGLYLLIETFSRDRAAFEDWLEHCYNTGLVSDGVIANSLAETKAMWAIREAIGDVDSSIGPHLNFDVGLAPSQLGEFAEACETELAELLQKNVLYLGHIADGNLHVIVPVPNDDAEISHRIERRVFDLLSARRGSVAAEHGIGTLKLPWLDRTRTAQEIELMRRLKLSMDPLCILNRGKVLAAVGSMTPESG